VAIDCPAQTALGTDQSKALLDSAGHPGLPIRQSMSGAPAEKASPLESVVPPLKRDILGCAKRHFLTATDDCGR
jgi:hypothetical protein